MTTHPVKKIGGLEVRLEVDLAMRLNDLELGAVWDAIERVVAESTSLSMDDETDRSVLARRIRWALGDRSVRGWRSPQRHR